MEVCQLLQVRDKHEEVVSTKGQLIFGKLCHNLHLLSNYSTEVHETLLGRGHKGLDCLFWYFDVVSHPLRFRVVIFLGDHLLLGFVIPLHEFGWVPITCHRQIFLLTPQHVFDQLVNMDGHVPVLVLK